MFTSTLPRVRGTHDARTPALMMAAMFVIGVANICWAEQLTVNGGFGWDGVRYGVWAKDFFHEIFVVRVPGYYVGRMLPSAVVHYALRGAGWAATDAHVILAFQIYNLACLMTGVWAWGRIAAVLNVSTAGTWLGFCFLFLNYAILKNNFYHAVLTDTTAFTLGILTVYCFLIDSVAGLLIIMVVGGFTWGTVAPIAALLLVLPREVRIASSRPALVRIFAGSVAAVAVAGLSAVSIRQLLHPERHQTDLLAWWPVSVLLVGVYLWVALRAVTAGGVFDVPAVFRAARWRRAGAAVLMLAGLATVRAALGNGEEVVTRLGLATFVSGVNEPAVFLLSHLVYYGPVIVLLVLFWRPCCARARELGAGMEILVLLAVIAAVNAQSRFLINVFPAFVVLVVTVLDRWPLRRREVFLWAVLCVLCSKIWYTFNTAPQIWDGRMETLSTFPLQHYFMNSPWISARMYFVQGAVGLALAIAIAVAMAPRRAAAMS